MLRHESDCSYHSAVYNDFGKVNSNPAPFRVNSIETVVTVIVPTRMRLIQLMTRWAFPSHRT